MKTVEHEVGASGGTSKGLLSLRLLSLPLAAFLAAGCTNQPTDQQVQQKTAETTQQVKQGAQQAADKARVAAANAEAKINAVAAGVKQGLNSGPSGTAIDLNTSSTAQLETLPGITPGKAHRIVSGRPYSTPNDLVTKNVLTQAEFDRISGNVQAQ